MNLIVWRGCPLQVLRSNPIIREVQLDDSGTSYKWTDWTVSAVVTYNPGAIGFSTQAAPGGRNTRGPGGTPDTSWNVPVVGGVAASGGPGGPQRMPADSDVAVRRFLEFPRGQLIIYSTDLLTNTPTNVVLCSPVPITGNPLSNYAPCDANNGPFCKVNSIQEIAGERMWQIHLTFKTSIYEDSLAQKTRAPIIVSNRWSVTIDTNWQHLTTRIIEGVVHFRADQLLGATNADLNNGLVFTTGGPLAEAFRDQFANFTVPAGFQRTQVLCKTLPSGNQVAYRIVDTDQPFQQTTNGKAVRLEYSEHSWIWQGSAGRGAAQAIRGAIAQGGVPIFSGPAAIGEWARNRVAIIPNAAIDQLPKRYKTVIVRAWGNRLIQRTSLIGLALAVANARMGTAAFIDTTTTESIVTYHSAQMMAQVQTTSKWSFSESGGIANPANWINLANLFIGGPVGTGDFSLAAFIGQSQNTDYLQQMPNMVQPPFPTDSGTRGTWSPTGTSALIDPVALQRMLTQTLENIGSQNPGVPP